MTLAYIFPGQGSQAVGMGADFAKTFPSVKERLDQAGDILNINLHALIAKGPSRSLAQTDIAQVAIYSLSYGIFELLNERGMIPSVVAGHSLGQFTALAVSGAISFDAGLSLVAKRGKFMHQVNQTIDGSMLAVSGLGRKELTELTRQAGEDIWLANCNAPSQNVLAGLRPELQIAHDLVAAAGGRGTWLDVAGPYHTPLLREAAFRFSQQIDNCDINYIEIPVIANTTASELKESCMIRTELHCHMLSTVEWAGTMDLLAKKSVDLIVEVGPGRVLKGLTLRNAPDIKCFTTGTVREVDDACHALKENYSCVSL